MRKGMTCLVLIMLLLVTSACAEWYIDGVTADRVHLREQAGRDSASLGLYYSGTEAERLSASSGEWIRVRIGVQVGYVHRDYLSMLQADSAAPVALIDNDGSWVNLRSEPSMKSTVLAQCQSGEQVRVMGETAAGWSYVRWGEMKGYMLSSFLREDVSVPSEVQKTTQVVGEAANGDFIHAYTADNRQTLYFTAMEREPAIHMEDVNFDGLSDLVIYTSMGASNAYCQLFVFDGTEYHAVTVPGLENSLCNMQLYPELGLVGSHANNGSAGALHEDCLYYWDGYELVLVRSAVGQEYTVTRTTGSSYITTVDSRRIQLTVRDYPAGSYEGEIIWESILLLDDLDPDIFQEEADAMWQGLRYEEGNG